MMSTIGLLLVVTAGAATAWADFVRRMEPRK
jgi:hypothetical protein